MFLLKLRSVLTYSATGERSHVRFDAHDCRIPGGAAGRFYRRGRRRLMTPFLIFYGLPPAVAVGTDLVYAAITKTGGLVLHHRRGTVHWRIVALLAAGSLPAAAFSVALLHHLAQRGIDYGPLITSTLGISLILTSIFLLFRSKNTSAGALLASPEVKIPCRLGICTVVGGAALGVLVTLSSVGAGASGRQS